MYTYLYLGHVLIATSLASTSDCPKLFSGNIRLYCLQLEIILVAESSVSHVFFKSFSTYAELSAVEETLDFRANRDVVPLFYGKAPEILTF